MAYLLTHLAVCCLLIPLSNQELTTQRVANERSTQHRDYFADSQVPGCDDDCLRGAEIFPQPLQTPNLTGSWQLAWDDSVDTVLDHEDKVCTIQFKQQELTLIGEFVGPVAGRERVAVIAGTLQGNGTNRILSFQQREVGYICSYQATVSSGAIIGVWHDTENRSGSFRLLKHQ